jgi:hypothetical protein
LFAGLRESWSCNARRLLVGARWFGFTSGLLRFVSSLVWSAAIVIVLASLACYRSHSCRFNCKKNISGFKWRNKRA